MNIQGILVGFDGKDVVALHCIEESQWSEVIQHALDNHCIFDSCIIMAFTQVNPEPIIEQGRRTYLNYEDGKEEFPVTVRVYHIPEDTNGPDLYPRNGAPQPKAQETRTPLPAAQQHDHHRDP